MRLLSMHDARRGALVLLLVLLSSLGVAPSSAQRAPETVHIAAALAPTAQPLALDALEHRTFEYFWNTANPSNGLVPDHWPLGSEPFASIAAVGFALTAYPIGVERGWITREQARQRVLTTLRFFANAPQGPAEDGETGYHGFYYHFLDMQEGHRYAKWVEVSTIDTTLLMGGVLFDESYFDGDNAKEREIRKLAETLYRNVDWNWAQVRPPLISMGWTPGGRFIPHDWEGYNEAMLLYVLALGSPTHPVKPDAWTAWTSTYDRSWGSFMGGQPHIAFAPLFGHQYSQAWIDYRGIQDAYMRGRGIDYFENSRRSTIGQRAYAAGNPLHFKGYGENVWGLTACNGPADVVWEHDGTRTIFRGYSARGADADRVFDDGTLAPTAAISSIVFAPQIVLPAIQAMYRQYGHWLYSTYGFSDAFNPGFKLKTPLRSGYVVPGQGWFDNEYLGIDEGPILMMIENYRSGFVWKVMRGNPHIRKGLQRAGFTGGWLDAKNDVVEPAPTSASSSTLAQPAAVPMQ
ncbi:MAG: glucoamylase family protein [Rhodanobacteraceae bacterium]